MIITFWMYAYCLLDTPEHRVQLEVRRLTQALKVYTDYKLEKLQVESKALRIKTQLNTV